MPVKIETTDTSFENSIIITEVLLAHKCTYRPGEICTVYRDGRNFSGFVCPLSGSAVYTTADGATMSVEVGEIAYLPEMSRYDVGSTDKGFTHYTVNFRLDSGENDKRSGLSPDQAALYASPSSPSSDSSRPTTSTTASAPCPGTASAPKLP